MFAHSVLFDSIHDLPLNVTWREFIIQNVRMHNILTIILYNLNIILALNVYCPHYTLLLYWRCILPFTIWQCCVLMCIGGSAFMWVLFAWLPLMQHYNLPTYHIYIIIFTLMQFGIDNRNWREIALISRLERGERIVDVCCNVRPTHSSVSTVLDNADRVKERSKGLGDIKC